MAPENITTQLVGPDALLSPFGWDLVALALYVGLACIIVVSLLLAARFLGHRTRSPLKTNPTNAGVAPSGPARPGYPVPFYLTAIFFVVFDVEVAFIASWAVAYDLLSWQGLAQIAFFIITLLIALFYLWRGVLLIGARSVVQRTL